LACQARRELDLDTDNEIASVGWLLRFGHAEVGIPLCPGWSGRSAAADIQLLAVDCLYGPSPASESFLEVELDRVLDVVAFAREQGMRFLKAEVSICAVVLREEWAYLRDDEMQILCPALDLIADIRKLDLAACLQALLDRHLQNAILCTLSAGIRVVCLPLDLQLLRRAVVQFF
jgi:hypothetical protein